MSQEQLTQALNDAATSLETISRLAGKPVHPDGTPTYLDSFPDVRSYAKSRAAVARAALSATQPAQAHWTEREPVRLALSRVGRVYIAGPMTGIEELNFPAFNAEADKLRGEGLAVLNPAEHGIVDGAEWADYLRHDIAGLTSCERIHLLRGWEKSKGAQLEVTIAQALGMRITYQDGAEPAQAAQSEPVKPLFAAKIAARKWAELQEQGARMQSIAFDGGKGGAGTIDPWGVVRWSQQAAQGEPMSTAKNHHQWLERVSFWAASVAGHPDFESGPIHDAAREIEAEADQLRSILMAQPAAVAQGAGEVVAWLWKYIGRDPYPASVHGAADGYIARSVKEMNPENPPYPDTWKPVHPLTYAVRRLVVLPA